MQTVVLAAFIVALTLLESFPLRPASGSAAGVVAAYLGGAVLLAGLDTLLSLHALQRRTEPSPRAAARHGALASLTRLWLVAGIGVVIWQGYGSWVLEDLGLSRLPLIPELAALLPFVAALVLVWILEHPFAAALRRRLAERGAELHVPSLGRQLANHLRHDLFFVAVPLSLILLARDLVFLYLVPLLPPGPWSDVVELLGAALAAGLVFTFSPLVLVRVLDSTRFPDGALRSELEAMCRRMGLRYREILLWRSGGQIANAGAMGLVRQARYILITDVVVARLAPAEIRAVFGHEAGHIREHHIFYSVLFALESIVVCAAVGTALAGAAGLGAGAGELVTLALIAITWAFAFGALSRRFERQSDVIGAWAAGGDWSAGEPPENVSGEGAFVFARALQQVALLNGARPDARNWRHGSIASRVAFILALGRSGGDRRPFERGIRRLKRALWIGLPASLALASAIGWLFG